MNVCVKFPLSMVFSLLPMLTQAAPTAIGGTEVTANADYVIAADSVVGLALNARTDLTVQEVKKGANVGIASFVVTGSNAAVAFENPSPTEEYCTKVMGKTSNKTIELCSDAMITSFTDPTKHVLDGKVKYAKLNPGSYQIRGGSDNTNNPNIAADTYTLAMTIVKYTP